MTREETKKNLPLITAYANGKTIQYYDNEKKGWINVDEDPSYCYGLKWRIKPELKYRPFKSKEECWNEMLKHDPFGWVTDGGSNYNISLIDESIVMVGDYREYTWARNYEHALEVFKFIDGQPFGIKE